MMKSISNWSLMVLMLVAAAVAWYMRPTIFIADQRPKVDMEELIPRQFGDWHEIKQSTGQIINPQQTIQLKKFYSQILSRTYVNKDGEVIMMSIAYGANQSDSMALHYPEVCYPAQGFQLLSKTIGTLATPYGSVPVKRLMTVLGIRSEPVTYWTTIGDKAVRGGIETKLTQLAYGVRGQIPDGLIFRLSSISSESTKGFELQTLFALDLLRALSVSARVLVYGLAS
jgi:EpsI family protein